MVALASGKRLAFEESRYGVTSQPFVGGRIVGLLLAGVNPESYRLGADGQSFLLFFYCGQLS